MKNVIDWVANKIPSFEKIQPDKPTAEEEAAFKQASLNVAPVIWLLGKTGAGKTSIVAAITGASTAEVGNGFAPCTKTASTYDFPIDLPLIRFLDTRGLGEAGYDAEEDMRVNKENAHLILAVMRASDPNQQEIIHALKQARQSHSDWPILVVQTGLHDLYDSVEDDHPE